MQPGMQIVNFVPHTDARQSESLHQLLWRKVSGRSFVYLLLLEAYPPLLSRYIGTRLRLGIFHELNMSSIAMALLGGSMWIG